MGLEAVDEAADDVSESTGGSLFDLAQHRLKEGKRFPNWVEVGAIGRAEA